LDAVRSKRQWLRLLAECVAELFGTAILVVFGCSGIAQYTLSRGVLSSFLSVNFAFGFGAMIGVYVAGPISGKVVSIICFIVIFDLFEGAHINPAVSIAMLSLRAITPLQCITYIISRK
jgi:glycerol uptake facilitator-like aquaporin